jgi:tetratricopeptide (TPR) repeat protein
MKAPRPFLVFSLLLVGVFALGTLLHMRALTWTRRAESGSVLAKLLGESRRLFANHFFVKADISFHSGYYPSIFDQARQSEERENAMAHEGAHEEGEHDEAAGYLKAPKDWIDRFGRNFRVTEHTHLEGDKAREMMPWLRISAELDPKRVETYTVAAYWLRQSLGRVDEAEAFLREGLRANPDSYEILLDLGRLYYENRHDTVRARNLWELALHRWERREKDEKQPDYVSLDKILMNLAGLEKDAGNYAKAIEWIERAKEHSPHADTLQTQIDELRTKLSSQPPRQ